MILTQNCNRDFGALSTNHGLSQKGHLWAGSKGTSMYCCDDTVLCGAFPVLIELVLVKLRSPPIFGPPNNVLIGCLESDFR
jgi:hypothetical protein